ncbi:unnamed protein product [Camellia sinensis]
MQSYEGRIHKLGDVVTTHSLSHSLTIPMGLLPCLLPCQSNKDSVSQQPLCDHLHSHSSTSSFSSQPSLPSLPSLTLSSQQPPSTTTHHHCTSTLKSHSFSIFSLFLEGKHLYSGSSNSEIRLWRNQNPSKPNNFTDTVVASGNSAAKSIVVSGEKLLFSAHQDRKIRVWKIINTDNESPNKRDKYIAIATLPTVNDRFTSLFSAKSYVKVRRHKKCTWVHHVDTVSALALSKDESLLYSVSWDRMLKVWRTSDFKCLESVWNAHDDAINAIALSNDGYVYTGSADKKIKVWKKQEGDKKHKLVATLEKHNSAINALALSTDWSVLFSGACDRSIIVWERDDSSSGISDSGSSGGGGGRHMVVVGALRGHTKAILCLAVVSDLLCSGSADKTVRIWRRGLERTYSCLAVLEGHRGPVKCLTGSVVDKWSGDNNSGSGTYYMVYTGSLDCDIKVWQVWVPFL